MDIAKCLILFFGSLPFFYWIGRIIDKNTNDFSYLFLLGYFFFTSLSAIFGMAVQIFALSWKLYYYYVIVLIVVFLVLFFVYKDRIRLNFSEIRSLIKNHYGLVLLSFILLAISFQNVWLFWANNHSDDGFYLSKIADYPFMADPFYTNMANGFSDYNNRINSYIVNTWELEASVFTYLFHISATVYTRFFLNLFNSFILVNTIYALARKVYSQITDNQNKTSFLQIAAIIVIFFSFNSFALESYGLLTGSDLWQFNSAMYLASSIIRTSGIAYLVMLFCDTKRITCKEIIIAIFVSIAFMSKSSISLPFIILTAFSFFVVYLFEKDRKYKMLSIIMIVAFSLLSIFLDNHSNVDSLLLQFFFTNLKSLAVIISIVVILLSFLSKSKIIYRINFMIIVIGIFMLVPVFNNVFETISVYSFVASRMLTCFMYTIFILAAIYSAIFIIEKFHFVLSFLISSIATVFLIFTSFQTYYSLIPDILDNYQVLLKNPDFIPNSTVILSEKLNDLSKINDLYILSPYLTYVNNRAHTLAVSLRFNAPYIKVVSALDRYGIDGMIEYSDFDSDFQNIYDEFSVNPTEENYLQISQFLKNNYINCLIVENEKSVDLLKELGYFSIDSVDDQINNKKYFILFNEEQ